MLSCIFHFDDTEINTHFFTVSRQSVEGKEDKTPRKINKTKCEASCSSFAVQLHLHSKLVMKMRQRWFQDLSQPLTNEQRATTVLMIL